MRRIQKVGVLALAGLAGLAGCASAGTETVAAGVQPREDLAGLPNFARVSEGLYRGAQPTEEGFRRLQQMGIKTVVNLRLLDGDADTLRQLHMENVHIPCAAWEPHETDVAAFLSIVQDPARQPVFVHCEFGADRTGLMVAAYRVVVQGWTREAAAAELPRYGFHEMYGVIRKFIAELDAERLRSQAGASAEISRNDAPAQRER